MVGHQVKIRQTLELGLGLDVRVRIRCSWLYDRVSI